MVIIGFQFQLKILIQKMNNIILTGVLISQKTHCGRIYPKESFDKAMREYNKKIVRKQRKEKLEKINKSE